MKGNGRTICIMVSAAKPGAMVPNLKVIILKVKRMGRVNLNGMTDQRLKAISKTIKLMDKVLIGGRMEGFILEIGPIM